MTSYNPGDVVLVKFPFTEMESQKQRPALVLKQLRHSSKIDLVNIAMITSKIESYRMQGDVLLGDWQAAELLHPSMVRLAKIATVDTTVIPKKLGKLSSSDLESVTGTFRQYFSFYIP